MTKLTPLEEYKSILLKNGIAPELVKDIINGLKQSPMYSKPISHPTTTKEHGGVALTKLEVGTAQQIDSTAVLRIQVTNLQHKVNELIDWINKIIDVLPKKGTPQ
jgi:hypothetical protein